MLARCVDRTSWALPGWHTQAAVCMTTSWCPVRLCVQFTPLYVGQAAYYNDTNPPIGGGYVDSVGHSGDIMFIDSMMLSINGSYHVQQCLIACLVIMLLLCAADITADSVAHVAAACLDQLSLVLTHCVPCAVCRAASTALPQTLLPPCQHP